MPIEEFSWLPSIPATCRKGALTIGNFDGVHLGHVALLKELRKTAQAIKGPAVVVTFDPHPLQILRPDKCLPLLTTVEDRLALLKAGGADQIVVLPATRELLHLTAREFFDKVILDKFAPCALVEGPNFGFGRNREGNVELLKGWGHGADIRLEILSTMQVNGLAASSSGVRNSLVKGAVGEASLMLGRPYRLRGMVGPGEKRGQKLGFPTANLERITTLIPGDGVYAVRVETGSGTWPGAANVGPNPTFGEQARKVEVHLIGFQGDLYGRTLAVDFVDRLRDTCTFADVDELVAQLRKDIDQAQTLLREKEIKQ
jgi:riboflavin kinase / FMN adenylyltransferase